MPSSPRLTHVFCDNQDLLARRETELIDRINGDEGNNDDDQELAWIQFMFFIRPGRPFQKTELEDA